MPGIFFRTVERLLDAVGARPRAYSDTPTTATEISMRERDRNEAIRSTRSEMERLTNQITDIAFHADPRGERVLREVHDLMVGQPNGAAYHTLRDLYNHLEREQHRRMHSQMPQTTTGYMRVEPSELTSINVAPGGTLNIPNGSNITLQSVSDLADSIVTTDYSSSGSTPDFVVHDELVAEDTGIAEDGQVVMPEGYARGAKKSAETFFSSTATCPECSNAFAVGDLDSMLICTSCGHEFERPSRKDASFVDNGSFQGGIVGGQSHQSTLNSFVDSTIASTSALRSVQPGYRVSSSHLENASPRQDIGMSERQERQLADFAHYAREQAEQDRRRANDRAIREGAVWRGEATNIPVSYDRLSAQQSTPAPSGSPLIPFSTPAPTTTTPETPEAPAEVVADTGPWRHPQTGAAAPSMQVASVSIQNSEGQEIARTRFPAIHVAPGDTLDVNYKIDIQP